eukprot:126388-Chlamydomonas_euryale.AAC.1
MENKSNIPTKPATTTSIGAADVGGRHCGVQAGDKQQVTAMMERLLWKRAARSAGGDPPSRDVALRFLSHHNVRMAGQVCWVGRSSMEVAVELWAVRPGRGGGRGGGGQVRVANDAGEGTAAAATPLAAGAAGYELCHTTVADGHGGSDADATSVPAPAAAAETSAVAAGGSGGGAVLLGSATFLMAARSLDLSRSCQVPGLLPGSHAEVAMFEAGERRQRQRQDRCAGQLRLEARHACIGPYASGTV